HRHMAAITRDGKIRWHRNLFDSPNVIVVPPPIALPGERPISAEQWRRNLLARLRISWIAIEPECARSMIDHESARMRGHYVSAGAGTHFIWLLDAKTGDFQLEIVH